MRSNNRENIEKLLSLFMEGMTTVEEEAQLANYFRSEKEIPKEWKDFQTMFAYFDNGMQGAPIADRRTDETIGKSSLSWHRWVAAACLLLAVGLAFYWIRGNLNDKPVADCTTEQHPIRTEAKVSAVSAEERHVAMEEKVGKSSPIVGQQSARDSETVAPKPVESKEKSPAEHTNAKPEASDYQQEIAKEMAAIDASIIEARLKVGDAVMQASGFDVVFNEDGTTEYKRKDSENQNIIAL